MTAQNKPSLAMILREYQSSNLGYEIRGNWAVVLTARPPSFGLVWLMARMGVSPMAVSFAALALALSLPFLALFMPLAAAGIAVCLAGWVFQILDCVDGALARITGQTSLLGRHVDFLTDMAQWALLYLSIGILADRVFDSLWTFSLIAAIAAWLRLFSRISRDAFKADGKPVLKPLRPSDFPMAFVAGLSAAIPFLALAGPWLKWAVLFLLIYSLLDFIDTMIAFMRTKFE